MRSIQAALALTAVLRAVLRAALNAVMWAALLAAGLVVSQGEPLLADPPARPSIRPVLGEDADFHSIHTYYVTCPESPDGRWLLFFRSQSADAHQGDVCIASRESDEIRVLATDVEVQDAHRVACQQWAAGGKCVLYQELQNDEPVVIAVDIGTGRKTVLGRGRQLGFGPADDGAVLLYGEHWSPAQFGDLEWVDLETGKATPLLEANSVRAAYLASDHAQSFDKKFGGRQVTLFFPIVSPDRQRLFLKLSAPNGGDYREKASTGGGSDRAGLFAYDLVKNEYRFVHSNWGHPAWHPNSRHILNMWSQGAVLIDAETGGVAQKLAQPDYLRPGGHPAFAPDGRTFAADGVMQGADAKDGQWAVVIGDFDKQSWIKIHEFNNAQGARSWRRSHPHPVFSRDGKRVYFNVSADRWTRLYVAEL